MKFIFAFIIVIIFLIVPISIVDLPPLLDYPIHLARGEIILKHGIDHHLAEIYHIDWRPIPNLAIDIWLLLLGQIVDVEIAGRLFLGACLILTVAGVAVLHRVLFEHWSYWPLLASIPAYHGALMAGFLNFSMGVALIPFGLAAWIKLHDHKTAIRLGVHAVFVAIIYFCHVLSLGLFGIVLGMNTLWRSVSIRSKRPLILTLPSEALILGLPFLVAAWFYLDYSLSEVVARDDRLLYGAWELGPKLRGLIMPVLTHHIVLDGLSLLALFGIPLALLLYGRLKLALGVVSGAVVLAIFFLILPGNVLEAEFVMERFLIVAVLISIAATQPHRLSPRTKQLIAAVFAILLISRSTILGVNWLESDDYYRRAHVMSSAVERGASVLIVSPFSDPEIESMNLWQHRFQGYADWHYALINIPNLHSMPVMPLTRRATFTQLHFMHPDKHVLSLKPAYQGLSSGAGGSATISPKQIFKKADSKPQRKKPPLKRFDYILVLYLEHLPEELLKEIERYSHVYRDQDMVLLDAKTVQDSH